METQRTVLWVIFSVTLLFLWNNLQVYNGHAPLFGGPVQTAQQNSETPSASGPTKVAASAPGAAIAGAAAPGSTAVPANAPAATGKHVTFTTDLLKIEFDTLGASILRTELLRHKDSDDPTANVVLLQDDPERIYIAQTGVVGAPAGQDPFPTHATLYTLQTPDVTMSGDSMVVRFEATSGGLKVVKAFTFNKGSYAIRVSHELTNLGTVPLAAPQIYLQLTRDNKAMKGQGGLFGLNTYTGPAVYTEEKKFQKVDFSDIEKQKASFTKEASDGWTAMIQHYFAAAWIPGENVKRENYAEMVGPGLFRVGSRLAVGSLAPGATLKNEALLFVGPQDQDELAKIAPGLDLVVDYGRLSIIAKPLFWLLQWLHGIVPNWGWSIVLLTLCVKALLFPLASAGYKSMARMKNVAPRMQQIREQYGDDRQKVNMAMMELYKTEKINPLGGCLPIFVQIPVFISLYWVILESVELRGAPWLLWIHDLSVHDPWYILPAFMTATMFLQTKMSPPPPDPMQAKVMQFMPLIFGGMMFLFPSGLVLYWCVNNVLSIAQQWFINHQLKKAGLK